MGNAPSCKPLIYIHDLGKYVYFSFSFFLLKVSWNIRYFSDVICHGHCVSIKSVSFPLSRTVIQLFVDALQSLSVISSLGRI